MFHEDHSRFFKSQEDARLDFQRFKDSGPPGAMKNPDSDHVHVRDEDGSTYSYNPQTHEVVNGMLR